MDVVQRDLLLRLREVLVADVLRPEDLLPALVSHKVLSSEDCNLIFAQITPQARMRQLLDLLPDRGANAFFSLCFALNPNYSWLSDQLLAGAEAVASQSQHDEPDLKEELFLDARLRGGVPLPPPHFVVRQDQVNSVRDKLQNLGRRECLVLHGMTGSGKSCLAAAALDCKELVLGKFKGVVLWVSLGDGVLPAQLALLNKLDRHWPVPASQQSLAHLPPPSTEEVARETLIARLLGKPSELKHGLLVLDDVTKHRAVFAFDIGCRALLLTQDTSILGNLAPRCTVIKMVPGFTETESLELLATSVKMHPTELWPQAREIHLKAWGFPLMISLIGGMLAQYEEDARHSDKRWQQYSDMLSRHHRSRRNSLNRPGLMEAITQSLDTLTPELRKRYCQLVIFDFDVNILPEVLETLWGVSKYEVEENMCILVRKSLASRRWNEELRCYVYGVHYLLLHFLYATHSDDEIMESHAQLVHRYEALVQGDWGSLPQDNYAHLFLASHIVRAGLGRSLLPDLLLSLSFVTARLRLSLPADLLRDFQRLREFLSEDTPELVTELEHYERFVRRWGDLIWRRGYLDPVQCALQESPTSLVQRAALRLALGDQNKQYFLSTRVQMTVQIGGCMDTRAQTGSLEMPGDFSTACLCCQYVLLAHKNGNIEMWDTEYNRSLHCFRSLTGPALKLIVSTDHTRLVAASAQGELLLWRLPSGTCTCQGSENPTPPPRLRQASWQPLHGDLQETGPIIFDTGVNNVSSCSIDFAETGRLLAWCCSQHLKVWKEENGVPVVLWHMDKLQGATACSFGLGDSVLFVAAGDIYLCDAVTGQILNSLPSSNPSCMLPIRGVAKSGGWCLELSNQQLHLWEWWTKVLGESWNPSSQVLNLGETSGPQYTSAALTPDQTLLGVVTDDCQLLVLQRASLTKVLCVPVPTEKPLLALGCTSPTSVRAVLGGGGGSVTLLDLDLDCAPYPLTHPSPPVWSHVDQKWIAQLHPTGDLRVLCGSAVYVVQRVTSIAREEQLLVFGTQEGLVATMVPADLPNISPIALGQLGMAVSNVSCSQGWVIAATDALELVVWGPHGSSQCLNLAVPVIKTYLLGTEISRWLLACTSYGLQVWDVGRQGADKGRQQQCMAVDLAPAVGREVLACALETSNLVIAVATSQHQVEVGQIILGPSPHLVPLHCVELPGDASALSLGLNAELLVTAVPSKQLLCVWSVTAKHMVARVQLEVAECVGQVWLTEDYIITGGSVLAWWKLPKTHNANLTLVQVLQLGEQRGLLSFTPAPGTQELLVSDARGTLKLVRPVGMADSPTQYPEVPWSLFPEHPVDEILLNIGGDQHRAATYPPSNGRYKKTLPALRL